MNASAPPPPKPWSSRRKWIVSLLFAAHLFAVFAAPCASPPPSSYAWGWLAGRVDGQDGLLTPYLRALFLNHGYRFFAPNPGPSHLVRYEIELRGGGQVDGRFPDPEEEWPRLLYHRMFMISETTFNLAEAVSEPAFPDRPAPPLLQWAPPEGMPPAERLEFEKQLATAKSLTRGLAKRLLVDHDGQRIKLYLQTHELPFPTDVLAGQKLNAPELYRERLLGEYSEEQL